MDRHEEVAKMIRIIPKLNGYLHRHFMPTFAANIKKAEWKTLIELWANPDMPMQYYSKVANVEGGSFTYIANKLERKGFVKRIRDNKDKRKTTLELTDLGREMTTQFRSEFQAHVKKQIVCLNNDELNEFQKATQILEKILNKLENH